MSTTTTKEGFTFTWDCGSLTVTCDHSPPVYYQPQIQGDVLSIRTTTQGSSYTSVAPLNGLARDMVESLAYACAGVDRD